MRIRNKTIALSQLAGQTFTSLSLLQVSNNMTPSSRTDSQTQTNAYANIDMDVESSYMIDAIGSGRRPKGVKHIKTKKELFVHDHYRSGAFNSVGGAVAGYRKGSDGVYQREAVLEADTKVATMLANSSTGAIPNMSVVWAQQDDQKVVQSLFNKARKPVVDGLLNLVESPEIPDALSSLTSYGPEKARNWEKIRTGFRLNRRLYSLSKLTKDLANKYLAYSFGVAPLISDATKVHSYLSKIRQDYEKFTDRKVRRISAVYRGSASYSRAPEGAFSFQGYATTNPETRYVLTYRDKNPYTGEFMQKLDFLLRRFGSAGPATFLWERKPFSFVVDWFIDTASVLDYLDSILQTDRIEVISLTKSMKHVCLTDCFKTIIRTDTGAIVQDTRVGQVTNSYYERTVLSKSTYVGLADSFGKRQAATSVALLRQKLKKL